MDFEALKSEILDLLEMDAERFEAIYYAINDLTYINHSLDFAPLHEKAADYPEGKYSSTTLIICLGELHKEGLIEINFDVNKSYGHLEFFNQWIKKKSNA